MKNHNRRYAFSERNRAICLIEWESVVNKRKTLATGWLCSEDGWIITAGHVFLEDGAISLANEEKIREGALEGQLHITFPDTDRLSARLLYAEKDNQKGSDFAVLCVEEGGGKIAPMPVNVTERYWNGEVSILGIGSADYKYAKPASGYAEGGMVDIIEGVDLFQHIICENAVQKGYSGAPVFSAKANAVIAIQSMASVPVRLDEQKEISPAEQREVYAMPIWQMIKRFPELEKHLNIFKRPFSGRDVQDLLWRYTRKQDSGNAPFSEETIDETILPSVTEEEERRKGEKDLNQPVLDALRRASDRNCFILGEEGGSGKTMILRKLFLSMLHRNSLREIPIYIELREVVTKYGAYGTPGMMFSEHIAWKLFDGEGEMDNLREKLFVELGMPSNSNTRYVLLLDGLNEVSVDRRQEICEEILFWAMKPHIRVIVTSRYREDCLVREKAKWEKSGSFEEFFQQDRGTEELNEAEGYNNDVFQLLTISKLRDSVIADYLKNCGISEEEIKRIFSKVELIRILKIPMYLTIFARLYEKKQLNDDKMKNQLTDLCTRGELLHFFFGASRRRIRGPVIGQIEKLERQSGRVIRNKEFIFDKIIPYIAFFMAKRQAYRIDAEELVLMLERLLGDERAVMCRRAKVSNSYRPIYDLARDCSALSVSGEYDFQYKPAELMIRFIDEELHIMRKNTSNEKWKKSGEEYGGAGGNGYEFLHENLRDYFAARWLQEDVRCFAISRADEDLSLALPGIPQTVLEFFGDICLEHESKPFCDEERQQWRIMHKSYIANVLGFLRGRNDEVAKSAVASIVRVMKYSRKGDLSGVDFRDIDLTETWLGGIRFSRAYEDTYFTANFDGAILNAANLIRGGHKTIVTCVIQDRKDVSILYSADQSGRILKWNCMKKNCINICKLDSTVRDMVITEENILFVATEHDVYRINLQFQSSERIYTTKAFLCNLKLVDKGIGFRTDLNPAVWIELELDEEGHVRMIHGKEAAITFWPASHASESRTGNWLITGGSSKTHRVQVFHKENTGQWNRVPVQTVPIPWGNHMNWIAVDRDEMRVLFCIQYNLYEYSLRDGYLDTEKFHVQAKGEIMYASYLYDENGNCKGILYSDGCEIVRLDNHYNEELRLSGGNGICHFISPFLVDGSYRFTRESSLQGNAVEKYHICMDHEIQEFDADTNVCNRIFIRRGLTKLGYYLSDQKVRIFSKNLFSVREDNFEQESARNEDYQFIDYNEMKGSVGFSFQKLGTEINIYDRYTGEQESFRVYEGLMIQRCPMRNLKGDISKWDYQEILRRYGAIL